MNFAEKENLLNELMSRYSRGVLSRRGLFDALENIYAGVDLRNQVLSDTVSYIVLEVTFESASFFQSLTREAAIEHLPLAISAAIPVFVEKRSTYIPSTLPCREYSVIYIPIRLRSGEDSAYLPKDSLMPFIVSPMVSVHSEPASPTIKSSSSEKPISNASSSVGTTIQNESLDRTSAPRLNEPEEN